MIPTLSFEEFAAKYCEKQECTPEQLSIRLRNQKRVYKPIGFVMLQCIVLDSSRLGERVILPYGGNATWQEVPAKPVSPRGLCSDISEVIAILPSEALPPLTD